MASRRAPELAGGSLGTFAESLCAQANTRVARMVAHMPPEDRATVLNDYASARRQLLFTLQVKLSHWRQLPHVLCSLAHHEPGVARAGAARALALFDSAGDSAPVSYTHLRAHETSAHL
eukprot:3016100-Alexandrium_andersonii.AAC.1